MCLCAERRAEWPAEKVSRGSVEGGLDGVHRGAGCKFVVAICCFLKMHIVRAGAEEKAFT